MKTDKEKRGMNGRKEGARGDDTVIDEMKKEEEKQERSGRHRERMEER